MCVCVWGDRCERMPRCGVLLWEDAQIWGGSFAGAQSLGSCCGCCCKEGVRVGGKASRCGATLWSYPDVRRCPLRCPAGEGGVWASGSTLRGVPRCAVPARLALQMWGLLTTSRCGAVPGSEGPPWDAAQMRCHRGAVQMWDVAPGRTPDVHQVPLGCRVPSPRCHLDLGTLLALYL